MSLYEKISTVHHSLYEPSICDPRMSIDILRENRSVSLRNSFILLSNDSSWNSALEKSWMKETDDRQKMTLIRPHPFKTLNLPKKSRPTGFLVNSSYMCAEFQWSVLLFWCAKSIFFLPLYDNLLDALNLLFLLSCVCALTNI